MQIVRFFIRAIRYQFVKIVLCTAAHDDRILFVERVLQWAIGRAR